MALTRKFLVAMGIEDAKIDEIINAHTDVTSALKQERDSYKEKAEQLDSVQKELNKANEKLKEFDENDSWQEKYNQAVADKKKVEKDFADYKQEVSDKETATKKKDAYKQLLKDIGISEKRLDSVLKVSDISNIELDDDGKIKDSKTITENVKKEWSDFIVEKGEKGADVPNPSQNNGGSSTRASVASQRVADFYKERYGNVTQTKED